jgi:hypothetical protein
MTFAQCLPRVRRRRHERGARRAVEDVNDRHRQAQAGIAMMISGAARQHPDGADRRAARIWRRGSRCAGFSAVYYEGARGPRFEVRLAESIVEEHDDVGSV